MLTFMSHSSSITMDQIETELEKCNRSRRGVCPKQINLVKRPITVRLIDLGWFFRDKKNFIAFSLNLIDLPKAVYASNFVRCILDQFWSPT